MIFADTSAVQWLTLGVAGIAAAASAAAVVFGALSAARTAKFTARFAQLSEHQVWQRDLRVRIYSDCTASSDQMMQLMTLYSGNVHSTLKNEVERRNAELEHLREYGALRMDLSSRVNEVQTFGSLRVGAAAVALGQGLILAADTIINIHHVPLDATKELLDKTQVLFNSFRLEVRASLRVEAG
jgi:hypothetical protein